MPTYQGRCHCDAVQFEVTADIKEVMECNCSICRRAGWKLAFVGGDQFKMIKGEDALQDYQFGKQHIHHAFCGQCGIRSFGWGDDEAGNKMYSVNVRCLDDFDFQSLPVNEYDGASL